MWIKNNLGLEKESTFKDFNDAYEFMKKVALIDSELDHHPDWTNCYNNVYIRLYTFNKKNSITERDLLFASRIDALTSIK